jgi:hypothetical protein
MTLTGLIWLGKWRAVLNRVMNLRMAYNEGNFLSSWETVSFRDGTVLKAVSSVHNYVTQTAVCTIWLDAIGCYRWWQTLLGASWMSACRNSAFWVDANELSGRDARADRKLTASRTAHNFLFASRHQSNWTALKAGVSHARPTGRMRPAGSLCAAQI